MKGNIGFLFFQVADKYDFKDHLGFPIRDNAEIKEFFEIIGPKPKRVPIDFITIQYRLQNPEGKQIFAVNKEQYEEIVNKEGQSFINEEGTVSYMLNLKSRLQKIPGLKKNYIYKSL